jgi:phage baseplate assembly protein W
MPYKSLEITSSSAPYQQYVKKTNLYRGFSSLDNKNTGSKLFDVELIQQDLINHFNTRRGSRVMNPNFGSIIWDIFMQPMTDQVKDALKDDITAICNADPRISPTQINLTEYTNGYILELTVIIKGTDETANIRLVFDQNIGLVTQ